MGLPAGHAYVGDSIRVSVGAIVGINGGLAYDANNAFVTSALAPAVFPNGVPALNTGELCIVDKAVAVAPLNFQGGLQFDANSRLVTVDVGLATAPISFTGSDPFDATGALVTSV